MPFTSSRPAIYVAESGSGEPLLCVPAFASSSAPFEPLAAHYGTRFRFVTYDHLGSGRSAKYSVPLTIAELAAGAVRVLDDRGIDSAHVLGVSLGGAVAQEVALRFPDRVRGLILIGTASAGPLATPALAGILRATGHVATDSVRRRRVALARALLSDAFVAAHPEQADAIAGSLMRHPPTPPALFGQLLAFTTFHRDADLGRIHAPTLVMHGEHDLLVSPANGARLAAGIRGAELVVVPGTGHACILEQTELVFDAICDWLDRRGPIGPARPPSRGRAVGERVTRAAALPIGVCRVQLGALRLAYRGISQF